MLSYEIRRITISNREFASYNKRVVCGGTEAFVWEQCTQPWGMEQMCLRLFVCLCAGTERLWAAHTKAGTVKVRAIGFLSNVTASVFMFEPFKWVGYRCCFYCVPAVQNREFIRKGCFFQFFLAIWAQLCIMSSPYNPHVNTPRTCLSHLESITEITWWGAERNARFATTYRAGLIQRRRALAPSVETRLSSLEGWVRVFVSVKIKGSMGGKFAAPSVRCVLPCNRVLYTIFDHAFHNHLVRARALAPASHRRAAVVYLPVLLQTAANKWRRSNSCGSAGGGHSLWDLLTGFCHGRRSAALHFSFPRTTFVPFSARVSLSVQPLLINPSPILLCLHVWRMHPVAKEWIGTPRSVWKRLHLSHFRICTRDVLPRNRHQEGGADEDVWDTANRKAYSVVAPTLQLSFAHS